MNFPIVLMVLRFLILKFDTRQRKSKPSAVEIKLRWRYFGKQSKIDSARTPLSIPIHFLRLCAILRNSNKSVRQESIAKRSSWLITTNIPSEE
jgi:hypothetical protein